MWFNMQNKTNLDFQMVSCSILWAPWLVSLIVLNLGGSVIFFFFLRKNWLRQNHFHPLTFYENIGIFIKLSFNNCWSRNTQIKFQWLTQKRFNSSHTFLLPHRGCGELSLTESLSDWGWWSLPFCESAIWTTWFWSYQRSEEGFRSHTNVYLLDLIRNTWP